MYIALGNTLEIDINNRGLICGIENLHCGLVVKPPNDHVNLVRVRALLSNKIDVDLEFYGTFVSAYRIESLDWILVMMK